MTLRLNINYNLRYPSMLFAKKFRQDYEEIIYMTFTAWTILTIITLIIIDINVLNSFEKNTYTTNQTKI
jgi:hypothetical protein